MNPQPWHRRRGTWTALAVGLATLGIFSVWEFYSAWRMDWISPGGLFLPFITGPVVMLAAAMVWAHRPPPTPRAWAPPPEYGGYPAQPPPVYREPEYRQPPPQAPMPQAHAPMPPAAPRPGDYGHLDDLFGGGR